MALDFPSSPTNGQKYPAPPVAGVPVYTWDGEKWTTIGGAMGSTGASDAIPQPDTATGAAGSSTLWSRGDHAHPQDPLKVNKAGDTMTGDLTVGGNITSTAGYIWSMTTATTGSYQFGNSGAVALTFDGTGTFYFNGGAVYASHYTSADTASTGTYYFGSVGGRYLTYDGVNFSLTGGNLNVNSGLAIADDFTVNGGTITIRRGTDPNPALYLHDNSINRTILYYDMTVGYTHLLDSYSGASLQLRSDANFFFAGLQAYKGGGGSWADSSDARIKNVTGDYTAGLDEIAALRPVTYTFKGNDTGTAPANTSTAQGAPKESDPVAVPYPNSAHYLAARDGKTFHGLVAQEVETILPELVTKREGFIDGVAVTDLRDIDSSPLIYALVNAVKELKARVEQLEAT